MEKEEEETLSTPGVIEKYQISAKIANGNTHLTQMSSQDFSRNSLLVPKYSNSPSGLITKSTNNSLRFIIRNLSLRV